MSTICRFHKPVALPYLAFFDWAEAKTKKGYQQVQCEHCGHWFFLCEFGEPKWCVKEAKARKGK